MNMSSPIIPQFGRDPGTVGVWQPCDTAVPARLSSFLPWQPTQPGIFHIYFPFIAGPIKAITIVTRGVGGLLQSALNQARGYTTGKGAQKPFQSLARGPKPASASQDM